MLLSVGISSQITFSSCFYALRRTIIRKKQHTFGRLPQKFSYNTHLVFDTIIYTILTGITDKGLLLLQQWN